jgi:hypothetical protein
MAAGLRKASDFSEPELPEASIFVTLNDTPHGPVEAATDPHVVLAHTGHLTEGRVGQAPL